MGKQAPWLTGASCQHHSSTHNRTEPRDRALLTARGTTSSASAKAPSCSLALALPLPEADALMDAIGLPAAAPASPAAAALPATLRRLGGFAPGAGAAPLPSSKSDASLSGATAAPAGSTGAAAAAALAAALPRFCSLLFFLPSAGPLATAPAAPAAPGAAGAAARSPAELGAPGWRPFCLSCCLRCLGAAFKFCRAPALKGRSHADAAGEGRVAMWR